MNSKLFVRPSSGVAGHIPRLILSNERDLVCRRLDEPHTAQNKIEAVQGKARLAFAITHSWLLFQSFQSVHLPVCPLLSFEPDGGDITDRTARSLSLARSRGKGRKVGVNSERRNERTREENREVIMDN